MCVRVRVSVSDLVSFCSCLLRSVCDGRVRLVIICCICVRSGRLRATKGLFILSSVSRLFSVSPVVGGMLLFDLMCGRMRCRSASA